MINKLTKAILASLLLLGVFIGAPASAQETAEPETQIFSPLPGEAVQGLVQVIGTIDVPGFQSYELAFSYKEDDTQTWFLISQGDTPVIQGVLGEWDTTVLTDSIYDLKVRVYLQNGDLTEILIESIRVRNYSPIETATSAPTQVSNQQITPTPEPTEEAEPTVQPTPTEFPDNPASVDSDQIMNSIKRGGIAGVIVIVLVLLITRPKRRSGLL
jgi:hypothetical protein